MLLRDDESTIDLSMPPSEQYSEGIHQGFLLLLGDGIDTLSSKQNIFASAVLLLGVSFNAAVIGQMSLVIQNMNLSNTQNGQKRAHVRAISDKLNLPSSIRDRIDKFFEQKLSSKHNLDGVLLLKQLPQSLYVEALMHVYAPMLKATPILADCDESFLRVTVTKLNLEFYTQHMFIIRDGDIGREMFFLFKGKAAVIKPDLELETLDFKDQGNFVHHFHKGDFFGEIALLANVRRTASIVSTSICDVLILARSDLLELITEFPKEGEKLREVALERYRQTSQKKSPANGFCKGLDDSSPGTPQELTARVNSESFSRNESNEIPYSSSFTDLLGMAQMAKAAEEDAKSVESFETASPNRLSAGTDVSSPELAALRDIQRNIDKLSFAVAAISGRLSNLERGK